MYLKKPIPHAFKDHAIAWREELQQAFHAWRSGYYAPMAHRDNRSEADKRRRRGYERIACANNLASILHPVAKERLIQFLAARRAL